MGEGLRDVTEVLMQDHREVERMFGELESMLAMDGARGGSRLKDLTDQVTIELVKHSVAEEAEVYPRVQDRVSGAEAEHARHEHAEAEETMKRLERLEPTDARFVVELQTLIREVREHVAEEEGEMFPKMRTIFTPDELDDMARKVERVKLLAPTRPHPSAPDTPPGDKVLGPVTGLLDRLRDAVSGRGAER